MVEITPSAVAILRGNGMTLREICDLTGMAMNRLKYIQDSEKLRAKSQRYYQKHKEIIKERTRDYKKDYFRKYRVVVNGKSIMVNKRPRPDNVCELCSRTSSILPYHHWDDDNPHRGVWICPSCHKACEFIEQGLHTKYLELKQAIIRDN